MNKYYWLYKGKTYMVKDNITIYDGNKCELKGILKQIIENDTCYKIIIELDKEFRYRAFNTGIFILTIDKKVN